MRCKQIWTKLRGRTFTWASTIIGFELGINIGKKMFMNNNTLIASDRFIGHQQKFYKTWSWTVFPWKDTFPKGKCGSSSKHHCWIFFGGLCSNFRDHWASIRNFIDFFSPLQHFAPLQVVPHFGVLPPPHDFATFSSARKRICLGFSILGQNGRTTWCHWTLLVLDGRYIIKSIPPMLSYAYN